MSNSSFYSITTGLVVSVKFSAVVYVVVLTWSSVIVSLVSEETGSVVTVSTVDADSVVVEAVVVSVDTVSAVAARPIWLARCLICFSWL